MKAQYPSKQRSKVYKQPFDSYQALDATAMPLALNRIKTCSGHPLSYVGQSHAKWYYACCAILRRTHLTLWSLVILISPMKKISQREHMIEAAPTTVWTTPGSCSSMA